MKKESKPTAADLTLRKVLLVAPWLMASLFLGPVQAAEQIEAQFKTRPLIVADSITTATGEDIVAQPDEEETPRPKQEKAKDVYKVQATNDDPDEQGPATENSVPKAKAKISPEAQTLLDQMRGAYDQLEGAELNGRIQADVEMSGEKQQMKHQFTSSYQAPNKFRHELEDGLVIGSTGQKTYIFQKSANAFFQQNAPGGKVPIRDLPAPIPQLLQTQNPSLLFAVIQDPIRGVIDNMREINKIGDIKIQGKSYPALALIPHDGKSKITVLMDPETHLLKRLDIEITPVQGSQTESGLQSVKAQIEYTTIRPQIKFDVDHFAWAPPDGAKDLGVQKEKTSAATQTLVGKPAPDFTLETLEGESVSLSDLKGQVVVLDFWATWCPPCVRSLPELDQIFQQKTGEGVKVYAINLKESQQQVQSFLQSRGLSVPVLLDTDGEVAQKFGIQAIPQTIVIGKDGSVRKVFVGASSDTPDQIRAEIDSAAGVSAAAE